MPSVADQQYEDAYDAWRASLQALVADTQRLARWQDRRFRHAHRIGKLLTEPCNGSPTTGPVVYGVFLPGAGLCYVGQTQEAERRLRDLPVGESHHLANTVPPELWERVVVVRWPELLDKVSTEEQATAAALGPVVCGLALEHRLQVATDPPLNSRRRNADGDWRPRNHALSQSRGAVHAHALPSLWQSTWKVWQELSTLEPPSDGRPLLTTGAGRVVFPASTVEGLPAEAA